VVTTVENQFIVVLNRGASGDAVRRAHDVRSPKSYSAAFTRGLKLEEGADLWLVGGGQINTVMLNAGLIDEMIITLAPTVLGADIPLFAPGASTTGFHTVSSQSYANGMVQWTMAHG